MVARTIPNLYVTFETLLFPIGKYKKVKCLTISSIYVLHRLTVRLIRGSLYPQKSDSARLLYYSSTTPLYYYTRHNNPRGFSLRGADPRARKVDYLIAPPFLYSPASNGPFLSISSLYRYSRVPSSSFPFFPPFLYTTPFISASSSRRSCMRVRRNFVSDLSLLFVNSNSFFSLCSGCAQEKTRPFYHFSFSFLDDETFFEDSRGFTRHLLDILFCMAQEVELRIRMGFREKFNNSV